MCRYASMNILFYTVKSLILIISLFICTMDIVVNIEGIVIPEIEDLPDTLVTVDTVTELEK